MFRIHKIASLLVHKYHMDFSYPPMINEEWKDGGMTDENSPGNVNYIKNERECRRIAQELSQFLGR